MFASPEWMTRLRDVRLRILRRLSRGAAGSSPFSGVSGGVLAGTPHVVEVAAGVRWLCTWDTWLLACQAVWLHHADAVARAARVRWGAGLGSVRRRVRC